MQTAKIFKNGNSQAVRLPKQFQFDVDEVEILQRGSEIILRKKQQNLKQAFALLSSLPDDFYAQPREDDIPGQREEL